MQCNFSEKKQKHYYEKWLRKFAGDVGSLAIDLFKKKGIEMFDGILNPIFVYTPLIMKTVKFTALFTSQQLHPTSQINHELTLSKFKCMFFLMTSNNAACAHEKVKFDFLNDETFFMCKMLQFDINLIEPREVNEIHQIINKTHLHIVDNLQKKTAERNVSGLFNANIHDGAFYF